MSILTSLYHDEEQLLPNSVHNEPPDDTRVYVRASPLTADARRHMAAMRQGAVHPALFYSGEAQIPCLAGVWEPPHAVESKLEMREEYPRG